MAVILLSKFLQSDFVVVTGWRHTGFHGLVLAGQASALKLGSVCGILAFTGADTRLTFDFLQGFLNQHQDELPLRFDPLKIFFQDLERYGLDRVDRSRRLITAAAVMWSSTQRRTKMLGGCFQNF